MQMASVCVLGISVLYLGGFCVCVRLHTHMCVLVHVYVCVWFVWFTDCFSLAFPVTYNEDAFILQVIEAYCNSTKTRHTVNSCKCRSPCLSACLLSSFFPIFTEEEAREKM